MLQRRLVYGLVMLAVICVCGIYPVMAQESKKFKVLVVMSYDDAFPWETEIREGIDSILKNQCEATYFYLDSRNNLKAVKEKAKQAYDLYQKLQPDGVIAADDDAQTFFVVPYLKDKVKIPVIFCGVNEAPEKYGYPASNVTGVLEVVHFSESISLLQQLVPSVKTVGYMVRDDPTGHAFLNQAKKESDTYSAKSVAFKTPKTLIEAVEIAKSLRNDCDALFIEVIEGITDINGKPVSEKESIPLVAKAFGKPIFCSNKYTVKRGALCAMIKLGQEQGTLSAEMLLNAMSGKSISEIPIIRNRKGKAIINITALKEFGIKPQPNVLVNAELVKIE
jgi:ABC-type uncharacterized transport system substrate-binding protein